MHDRRRRVAIHHPIGAHLRLVLENKGWLVLCAMVPTRCVYDWRWGSSVVPRTAWNPRWVWLLSGVRLGQTRAGNRRGDEWYVFYWVASRNRLGPMVAGTRR